MHALDDERLATVEGGQIDGPAGKGNLRPGRLENLVGGHNDTAIGLKADREAIVLIRANHVGRENEETQQR
jgi:hypothetical protein